MKRSQHMNCRNGSSSNMPWLWKYQMQAAKVKTRGKCSLFTFYVCVMNVQALNSTLVNILIDHTFTRGILAKLKQGWKLRISNVDICYLNLSFRACSHEARYLGWHAGISMLAGISRVPEISRCARVSLFWKLVRSHETGITRGAEISRLDYPGYPVNRDNYYPCERSAPGYLGGGRDNFDCNAHDQYSHMEANTVEIADAKCEHAQYARRNPFNWYRTTAKRESFEKTDRTKFLFNTMHLVLLKYNFPEYCYGRLK